MYTLIWYFFYYYFMYYYVRTQTDPFFLGYSRRANKFSELVSTISTYTSTYTYTKTETIKL